MNENKDDKHISLTNTYNDEVSTKPELLQVDAEIIIENFRLLGKDYSSGMSPVELLIRNGEEILKPRQAEYAEILFKGNITKICDNPKKLHLHIAQFVFIECCDNILLGVVNSLGNRAKLKALKPEHDFSTILRIANQEEINLYREHINEENEIVESTKKLALEYSLEMKVTEAEWQYDRQKLTIFFTASQRVDFRELVKELARKFKTRIELRQISSRDETRRSCCGVGPCGRDLCCQTFLKNFDHITLDHARTQRLVTNLSKLTGNCGRLKCCLRYEYDVYVDSFRDLPPINSVIETENGVAKIVKFDIFREMITCYLDEFAGYVKYTFEDLTKFIEDKKVYTPKNIEGENFYDISSGKCFRADESEDLPTDMLGIKDDEYLSFDELLNLKTLNAKKNSINNRNDSNKNDSNKNEINISDKNDIKQKNRANNHNNGNNGNNKNNGNNANSKHIINKRKT